MDLLQFQRIYFQSNNILTFLLSKRGGALWFPLLSFILMRFCCLRLYKTLPVLPLFILSNSSSYLLPWISGIRSQTPNWSLMNHFHRSRRWHVALRSTRFVDLFAMWSVSGPNPDSSSAGVSPSFCLMTVRARAGTPDLDRYGKSTKTSN